MLRRAGKAGKCPAPRAQGAAVWRSEPPAQHAACPSRSGKSLPNGRGAWRRPKYSSPVPLR
eukprot:12935194-Prorocentrum_lima.AAC.1